MKSKRNEIIRLLEEINNYVTQKFLKEKTWKDFTFFDIMYEKNVYKIHRQMHSICTCKKDWTTILTFDIRQDEKKAYFKKKKRVGVWFF
jgi:hypothetical protein